MRWRWQLYLLLLPAAVYFVIFHYVPMYGAQIAFKDYFANKGIWGSPWVGMENFERFFNSYYFWRLLRNTLILSVYQLLLFPLPLMLALALNELRSRRVKKWVQTITYAPHFIAATVLVGMLVAFLDPSSGLVNHVVQALTGRTIEFMQSPGWFPHLFVWSGLWQHLGWSSIIFLAALTGVNPSLLEAAQVDGASRLRRIWHVNLPAIRPTIMVVLILEIGSFMSIGFEKVLLMQNSLNAPTSDVIQTYVYQTGLLDAQYSYASAIGLFDSAINVVLIITMNQLSKRMTREGLW